jgi:transketolase
VKHFETLDLIYRSLCALLFNYVPTSGHPGGSISSGRLVAGILFDAMDYDVSDPDREDADVISYAAGHKAMGLYALWALRNEVMRIGAPELMPAESRYQLRLEDLLGFRRNPITKTPIFPRRSMAIQHPPLPSYAYLPGHRAWASHLRLDSPLVRWTTMAMMRPESTSWRVRAR